MNKVVIIGAGPAGLTAAYELLNGSKEYEVLILEESNTVGGISRTVQYNGNRMDIGGHRFFSKDDRVMSWWTNQLPLQGAPAFDDKKLGRDSACVNGGPDPDTDDEVMLRRNRISRIYYNKHFFDYPISMKAQTFINMGFAQTMKAGFSYLGSCVHKLPEDSLENFYINRFGKVLYSMFFEGYTEKLWGRHPREISADWGSQRVKGLSITELVKNMLSKIGPVKEKEVETSLIESFLYPKYGPGQLWEHVADGITKMGGRIQFESSVQGVTIQNGKVTEIQCRSAEGQNISVAGDIFISSMPVKDLIAGMGDSVPEDVHRIANGLPYRDFVTVGILTDKLNLKNETAIKTFNDQVPDCWIYVQDTGVKLGRIQVFNNWSPYMVKDVEHTVWLGLEYFCTEGDSFWTMSDEETARFAADELVRMGIINAPGEVKDSHVERIKKAYPAYFDTYSEMQTVIDYLNSIDNLYCIGRNGQHRYNNMDHSMATAFEAVELITGKKDDRNALWNVNTEKEYHETRNA